MVKSNTSVNMAWLKLIYELKAELSDADRTKILKVLTDAYDCGFKIAMYRGKKHLEYEIGGTDGKRT